MKIAPPPSFPWPCDKAGVLEIAERWYDPARVAVNSQAIQALDLPTIQPGADEGMKAGKLGADWLEVVAHSIALNSINYQFWDLGPDGKFIRYAFEAVEGAMGMRLAFDRAWTNPASPLALARDSGIPLTVEDVKAMFGDIPAAQSRADILNEVLVGGKLRQVSQDVSIRMTEGGKVDTQMGKHLADHFPEAYGDPVLKKAQLAISETWVQACERGAGIACELTAFADYQIPNILRAMGVLEYSPALAAAIDARAPLDYDGADERAIRAASLLAVERIAQVNGADVAAVDHYLWARRKEAKTPFHLTFTTAY